MNLNGIGGIDGGGGGPTGTGGAGGSAGGRAVTGPAAGGGAGFDLNRNRFRSTSPGFGRSLLQRFEVHVGRNRSCAPPPEVRAAPRVFETAGAFAAVLGQKRYAAAAPSTTNEHPQQHLGAALTPHWASAGSTSTD